MVPQMVNLPQRFRPFSIGLGHVTDAKGALGLLEFLGNNFF